MSIDKIVHMRKSHQVLCEFPFEIKELNKGYSDRFLRIDLGKNEISIHPVTQQMKYLWTGGKGFDLWLMFREIDKDTKWDSPNNPICFSPGPLGGTTSFPGSGKTLVTSISPLTQLVVDCNVGGFFGPYLKFSGFDALVIIGKARKETIVLIDAVKKKITIEAAPEESVDSHVVAEELTEMYAENDLDKRNIAVVSAGRAAQHSRIGILNFSFWDWRRNVARLKQAGRGGVGTVFRDKMLKALVIRNRDITPAWRVEENKVAASVNPKKIVSQPVDQVEILDAIIEKWGNDPEFVIEIMQDIQERFRYISLTAIERIVAKTGAHKAYLYHIATFDKYFTLEEKAPVSSEAAKIPAVINVPSKQRFIALRNHASGNTREIERYIAAGGYESLKKVLNVKDPESVTRDVTASGLRDRGWGDSVGTGWDDAVQAKKDDIYIVCTAADGEPNAEIGKFILETDPHSVIEGMIIGAYATGAKEGFIVINKEHSLAEERLCKAIGDAQTHGFLGGSSSAPGFSFNIHVHRTGGSTVYGEVTSLLTAMGGRAGDARPDYIPVEESGFRQKPTVVTNVETWANVPVIFEKGAQWFASNQTKVFFLTGDVRNTGFVEVPLGTTLREIIMETGGGLADGSTLKGVRFGGPSGGIIPADRIDEKIDFDTVAEAGAVMGSGSITVLNDKTCVVEDVRQCMEFLAGESCGKCTPCREGLFAVKNALNRICNGEGKDGDIAFLEETAETVAQVSMCRFGRTAPNPLTTSLRYFREEYQSHIDTKTCKAGACKSNA
jgi:NADP-reducing hydrogenase subunit HndC